MIVIGSEDATLRARWRRCVATTGKTVHETASYRQLLAGLADDRSVLVLLDLRLPGLNDGDGIEALLARYHEVRLLAFSVNPTDAEGLDLVHLGARGFMPLNAPEADVTRAVATLLAGELWFSRHLLSLAVFECFDTQHRWSRIPTSVRELKLTPRQLVVALLVADGLSNKQIARQLNINEGTVKAHLSAIFDRTGVSNRTSLARLMNQDAGVSHHTEHTPHPTRLKG